MRDESISAALRITAFFIKEEEINRTRIIYAGILSLLAVCGGKAFGRGITAGQAERVVSGWLRADAPGVQARRGGWLKDVQVFGGGAGEPAYYVVCLKPSGFVIVSADDEVEPIIGFSEAGTYDPSPDNPLAALVAGDLNGRIASIRAGDHLQRPRKRARALQAKKKWDRFVGLAETGDEGFTLSDIDGTASAEGATMIADVRIAPLLGSLWGQREVCDAYCYNYYTPGHYRSGCVGTAMAQLMRHYKHPTDGIGIEGFWIRKDNSDWYGAYTRGGDGSGGPYNWDYMMLVPTCSITLTQRRAIGALCYDAAISVNTIFGYDLSQADVLRVKDSLVETFHYANAVRGYNGGADIGQGLIGMINPNLDARAPVIIGIQGATGHAAVCDGYGYSSSTLYHHLNMGWKGSFDAWYNLPDVDSDPSYDTVYKCIYNIHRFDGGVEYVSGRVFSPSGEPISQPTVYARCVNDGHELDAISEDNGIYAFDNLRPATGYTIFVSGGGYTFRPVTITTGTSQDDSAVSGNLWGVDIYGQFAGDVNGDFVVDMADYAVLTAAYLAGPSSPRWNPDCDISSPKDGIINMRDINVFLNDWLSGRQ